MKTIPLIQFGLGGVGGAVVERVLASRHDFARRYGIRLNYIALCDSGGAAISEAGFSPESLERTLAAKTEGIAISDMDIGYYQGDLGDIVDVAGTTDAIVIDVTATHTTTDALLLALDRGYAAVLANKKPLTADYATFRRMADSGRLRYEATVGAGVPVIATLRQAILASHDAVTRIEGCFSGTLGYLTTGLQAGKAFSALVRQAKTLGYTEPDPREDLGGMDVARKALILARTIGWPLELDQVAVEPLYPPELDQGSVEDFLAAVSTLDADYQQSVVDAGRDNRVLRYVAALADGAAQVGLQSVPQQSPIGRLHGTDNIISFYSDIYADSPLVLQGRGAGVHGTAAGVLADIVALAQQ